MTENNKELEFKVKQLDLKEDSIIVLMHDWPISEQSFNHIKKSMERLLAPNKIIILEDMDICVLNRIKEDVDYNLEVIANI